MYKKIGKIVNRDQHPMFKKNNYKKRRSRYKGRSYDQIVERKLKELTKGKDPEYVDRVRKNLEKLKRDKADQG